LRQNCAESSGVEGGSQSGFKHVYLQQERGEYGSAFFHPFDPLTTAPNRPFFRSSTLKIWLASPTSKQAPAPLGDKKLTILDNPVALSSRQARAL
jgi:hypothetical protein